MDALCPPIANGRHALLHTDLLLISASATRIESRWRTDADGKYMVGCDIRDGATKCWTTSQTVLG